MVMPATAEKKNQRGPNILLKHGLTISISSAALSEAGPCWYLAGRGGWRKAAVSARKDSLLAWASWRAEAGHRQSRGVGEGEGIEAAIDDEAREMMGVGQRSAP